MARVSAATMVKDAPRSWPTRSGRTVVLGTKVARGDSKTFPKRISGISGNSGEHSNVPLSFLPDYSQRRARGRSAGAVVARAWIRCSPGREVLPRGVGGNIRICRPIGCRGGLSNLACISTVYDFSGFSHFPQDQPGRYFPQFPQPIRQRARRSAGGRRRVAAARTIDRRIATWSSAGDASARRRVSSRTGRGLGVLHRQAKPP